MSPLSGGPPAAARRPCSLPAHPDPLLALCGAGLWDVADQEAVTQAICQADRCGRCWGVLSLAELPASSVAGKAATRSETCTATWLAIRPIPAHAFTQSLPPLRPLHGQGRQCGGWLQAHTFSVLTHSGLPFCPPTPLQGQRWQCVGDDQRSDCIGAEAPYKG